MKLIRKNKGSTLVVVTIVGALSVTALVGISQLAANYAQQQAKNRKASRLLSKKELALEYLRSKFIDREMANGSVGKEWSIRNNGNRVEVSAQKSYCYEYNASKKLCSEKNDPFKAPIRDVYRRWQMIEGKNLCALVTPYQEYTGTADPQLLCAPHYDEYDKDGSRLASIQTTGTIQSDEQQKAYVTVVDLNELNPAEQDQYLSGTMDITAIHKSLVPLRVTFVSFVENPEGAPDEITVSFDDGERGQIFIPKTNLLPGCLPGIAKVTSTKKETEETVVDGMPVYIFKSSDPDARTVCPGKARVLLVGGGGGGGNSGGGGGGGVLQSEVELKVGAIPVVIGAGGAGSYPPKTGGSTSFLDFKVDGGGAGGTHCNFDYGAPAGCQAYYNHGQPGASGGGAAYNWEGYFFTGGRATSKTGFPGAGSTGSSNQARGAGGGGGAGGPANRLNGGIGVLTDILGGNRYFGGGGAAGSGGSDGGCIGPGSPGLGGGGNGAQNSCLKCLQLVRGGCAKKAPETNTPGEPNTGGGGGSSLPGGSGVVIIRALGK